MYVHFWRPQSRLVHYNSSCIKHSKPSTEGFWLWFWDNKQPKTLQNESTCAFSPHELQWTSFHFVVCGSYVVIYLNWTPTSVDPCHLNMLCMYIWMYVHPTLSAQHVAINNITTHVPLLRLSKMYSRNLSGIWQGLKLWTDNITARVTMRLRYVLMI